MRRFVSNRKKRSVKKVSRDYCGICELRQLPSNTYFKVVKKDGSLSKTIYWRDKDAYNRSTKKYEVCPTSDVWGNGRPMSGKTKVSTDFIY